MWASKKQACLSYGLKKKTEVIQCGKIQVSYQNLHFFFCENCPKYHKFVKMCTKHATFFDSCVIKFFTKLGKEGSSGVD